MTDNSMDFPQNNSSAKRCRFQAKCKAYRNEETSLKDSEGSQGLLSEEEYESSPPSLVKSNSCNDDKHGKKK